MPVEIVVDAMGSDKAPESEIRGAILASRLLDVDVTLVGPEDVIRPALETALQWRLDRLGKPEGRPIRIVNASEWITMDDKAAAAVRSKRDSSMRVGLKRVREGTAQGFFYRREHGRGDGLRRRWCWGACPASTGRRWPRFCRRLRARRRCCWMWARMWTRTRKTWCSSR